MMIRRHISQNRRGVSAVESAIVYPVTMMLLIGTIAVSLGNFRYQQLQSLAQRVPAMHRCAGRIMSPPTPVHRSPRRRKFRRISSRARGSP